MHAGLGWRSRLRPWLPGACFAALLACGSTARSPGTSAEPDSGGSSAGAAVLAGSHSGGSGSGGSGGGPALLLGGTAGSVADNSAGELNLGGAPDPDAFHGPVDLCLSDEQIPDNWGAAGAMDVGSASCAVGVLGRFAFNRCRYELLDSTPFDVDPFTGGHSHCCYRSSLIGCP
jgi:hypothetical protein